MANRRDVELIIKAKEDATTAVDAVVEALRTLIETQQAAGESAQQSEGLLNQLASSIQNLATELKGTEGLKKLADDSKAAAQASQSLVSAQDEIVSSVQEAIGFVNQYAQAQKQAATASQQTAKATTQQTQAQTGFSAVARQAAQAVGQQAQSTQQLTPASNAAAGSTKSLGQAFRELIGQTRQSESVLQRIRSEVLSLVVAYVGLRAVIGTFRDSLEAFRTIEAAQVRLGAVFGNTAEQIEGEMTFLEALAGRLGIAFDQLTTNYTKFAIAAKQANFTTEGTRKIFVAVAEAARVLRLDAANLEGVFYSLEQIVSKGVIRTEELRRQLGNRLPGAFSIMATAIGVSEAKLNDLLATGKLVGDERTLIKFANALTEAYGKQLPEALDTVSAEIGKFQNELLFAQKRFADGFVGPLRDAITELNTFFRSRDGRDFFLSLGTAAGTGIQFIGLLARNVETLITIFQVLIALKLTKFFLDLGTAINTSIASMRAQGGAVVAATVSLASYRAQLAQLASTLGVANGSIAANRAALAGLSSGLTLAATRTVALRVGLGALRAGALVTAGAIRALWVAVGGLPGLLITGTLIILTDLFARWAGSVDNATHAIDRHKQVMLEYEDTINQTGDSLEQFRERVNIDYAEAEQNVRDLTAVYDELKSKLDEPIEATAQQALSEGWETVRQEIIQTTDQFQTGVIGVEKYREAIEKLGKENPAAGLRALAQELIANTRGFTQQEAAMERASLLLQVIGPDAQAAAAAFKELRASADDGAAGLGRLSAAQAELNKKLEEEPDRFRDREEWIKWIDEQIAAEQELGNKVVATREQVADAGRQAALEAQAFARLTQQGVNNITFGQLRAEMDRMVAAGEDAALIQVRNIEQIAEAARGVSEPLRNTQGQIEEIGTAWFTVGTSIDGANEKFVALQQPMSAAVEAALGISRELAVAVQQFEGLHGSIEPFGEEFAEVAASIGKNTEELIFQFSDVRDAIKSAFEDGAEFVAEIDAAFGRAVNSVGDLEQSAGTVDESFKLVAQGISREMGIVSADVSRLIEQMRIELAQLVQQIESAKAAAQTAQSAATPGFAGGGEVFGAGTGTSDSILARLSKGEFVIRAAMVKKFLPLLEAINSGKFSTDLFKRMQGFKLGGLVRPAPLPAFASGGLVGAGGGGGLVPVHLHFGDQEYELMGPRDVVQAIVDEGRRVRMTSTGKLPGAER
jgi:tape measure domain-containing protein